MIELTGDEIVNTLVMERQVNSRRVIVVEGQEDFQLLELHLDDSVAYLQFAGSKAAVLKAAELCAADNIDWVVFVVDADFDRINGVLQSYPPNVIASEGYDLLMDVVSANSRVVAQAIITLSPPNTEREIRLRFDGAPVEIAMAIAEPVGVLRYLVISGEFGFSVRNWPFRDLAESHLIGTLNEAVAAHAADRSSGSVEASSVAQKLKERRARVSVRDRKNMISGHDLAAAIAEMVRFQSGKLLGHDWICAAMRVALSCQDFHQIEAVRELVRWADVTGGSIFRCKPNAA